MPTLWGTSLQSLVEPFFELYESLVRCELALNFSAKTRRPSKSSSLSSIHHPPNKRNPPLPSFYGLINQRRMVWDEDPGCQASIPRAK